MSDIVIIGGGFAGVWAAAAAARVFAEAETQADAAAHGITLISPSPDLVIRPRLYEADPHTMRVPLDDILGPVGVRRIEATVTGIDTASRRVTTCAHDGVTAQLPYGRLIVATGSTVTRPEGLPGAEHHLDDVDTIESASRLDARLRALPELPPAPGRFTAVVVGSGFTGLEVATELRDRLRAVAAPCGAADEVRVVLLERAADVGPGLGAEVRPVIAEAFDRLGIEAIPSATLAAVTEDEARLADGTVIPARLVVWTAGMRAHALTEQIPAARDGLGRLAVDDLLRVDGVPGVYAAGDTAAADAEPGQVVAQSCQHAIPLGKHAGHNAAADLLGIPQTAFAPTPYVTCLDLGGAGAVFTTGWDRSVALTGTEAKTLKRTITERWIYPPTHNAPELLRQADLAYVNGGAERADRDTLVAARAAT